MRVRAAALAAALATIGCKRAPDPEATVRSDFVARVALAEDAGAALHLTSTGEIVFDDGWYPLETEPKGDMRGDAWRWMGRVSVLRVRAHDVPMKLVLRGWVPLDLIGSPPMLTFRFNGRVLEAFIPPPGRFTRELVVPAELQAGAEFGDFTIETSSVGTANDDPRELGFAAAEVRWERAAP